MPSMIWEACPCAATQWVGTGFPERTPFVQGHAQTIEQRPMVFLLPPLGAIFFVLRLDGVARLLPVGVFPAAKLVEVAAHRQRLCAVHRDGLAIDPVAAAGNQ